MQATTWTTVGLVCLGTPLAALMVLGVATGHTIKGKIETIFFGAIYGLYWSGRLLVPFGVLCLINGAIVRRQ